MGEPAININQKATYKDYLNFIEEQKIEVIDGIVYNMSPAPNRLHQQYLMNLVKIFGKYLENKDCRIYSAPFDVLLIHEGDKEADCTNIVQPDLSIICDKNKLTDKGCTGSPDMIVEITSPSTLKRDTITKLNLYEKYGVKEYWIVFANEKALFVYKLNNENKYEKAEIYDITDNIKVNIFENLYIEVNKIFED